MSTAEKAQRPIDVTRLFVERANDGEAAGIAALYEERAVMDYPPGGETLGREAIREPWRKVLGHAPHFQLEPPLPTLINGDIALTSTVAKDGTEARAQVARRQPDGTGLRLLDQTELIPPTPKASTV
jgi:ketosteroid isomerase-like protein